MPSTNIAVSHSDTGFVTAEVTRAERISPSFVRVTVAGEELAGWRHLGFDQWFRLAIPVAGESTRFDRLSKRFDMRGYLRYLTLPKATRPAIRNYTVREFRRAGDSGDSSGDSGRSGGELDIDFVVHGDDGSPGSGIAGPWAASLPLGARVALIDQGCGYRPVEGARRVVLAGDESALPAVLGILRDLPRDVIGEAIIEVPDAADEQPHEAPAGVEVRWITRAHGAAIGEAALAALRTTGEWDEPVSAFVAGEQRLASGGRRFLVNDRGLPKNDVDFCGYWRA
ncbi:MAG: siderophore-interacting protein [Leucobacter sp.]